MSRSATGSASSLVTGAPSTAAGAAEQEEQVRNCPLCGRCNRHAPPHPLSPSSWRLKQCTACRFIYLESAPAYEALEEELAWEGSLTAQRQRRRRRNPLRSALSGAVKRLRQATVGDTDRAYERWLVVRYVHSGRVLDVGCGRGATLLSLPPRFEPYGIEISRALAAEADAALRERGGRVVQAAAVEGLLGFPEGFFDGAILRAYLEHETQPRLALRRLRPLLKPGAHVVVKVPNYASLNRVFARRSWCGFRFPDHVNYFTPTTLRQLVEAENYEVRRFGFLDHQPFNDSMWMVAAAHGG